jgi:hypothetical protein
MNCRMVFFMVTTALLLSGVLPARDMQSFDKNIPADTDIKRINLESDISIAELTISTHDGGDLLTSEARYDADRVDVDVDFEKAGASADLYISSEKISRRLELDTDDCRWDISLSRDYIWDVDLDIGFADGEVDLSGLPVERLKMDIGASECRVVFDQPNPERLRKFEINAGAGDIEMTGLGYSNFEHLSFDGGAGKFVLNFDGLDKGHHTAKIDVGVGEARIELPENYPIRVLADKSWLSTLVLRGGDLEEVEDGVYETEDFDDFDYGLELNIDMGIGKTTIGSAGDSEAVLTFRRGMRSDIYYSGHDFKGLIPAIPAPPDLPSIPSLAEIPEIPDLPELSLLPEIPAIDEIPEIPEMPEIPELPALMAPPHPPSPPAVPAPPARKILE